MLGNERADVLVLAADVRGPKASSTDVTSGGKTSC